MPNTIQYIVGQLIAAVVALLAAWFGWRQLRSLDWLKRQTLSEEDRSYYRSMVVRRLTGCVLLFALAVMFAGLFGMDLLSKLDELMAQGPRAKAEKRHLTAEQQDFVYFTMGYA